MTTVLIFKPDNIWFIRESFTSKVNKSQVSILLKDNQSMVAHMIRTNSPEREKTTTKETNTVDHSLIQFVQHLTTSDRK